MTAPTRYAKSGDVHVAYQVVGEGPHDIVYVPGWVSHLERSWDNPGTAYVYNRLASFARLILFDKRGTGLSDPTAGGSSLDERMDDLRAVMDAAGSERAVLFGECEGGPMSLVFAASHPERVEGLALYGTMPAVRAPGAEGRVESLFDGLGRVVSNWGEGMTVELFGPTLAGNEHARRSHGEFERSAASPGMAAALLDALRDVDVEAAALNVQAPTLILHRRDDVVPIEHARRLSEVVPAARLVELEGEDHALTLGDTDAVLDEVEEFVTGSRRAPAPDRALLTILFTDIVDSTGVAGELGDARWRSLLDEHNRIVRQALERYRGREVKTVGDGFVATFDGPARAIRCATAITAAVRRLDIDVRAGIHTGEIELLGGDIGGVAVHTGARVAALAGPGEVLVTRTVRDLVAGSGLRFVERGRHELKGVAGEWELLAARGEGVAPSDGATARRESAAAPSAATGG